MYRSLSAASAGALKLSLIAFLFSPVTLVWAQGGALEEVIVTAQKREESIQDVGIAITAFSGEQLDALRITESTGIAALTPGVHMSGNNAGHTQQFTIRGATQNDFFDLAEAPNAVYVDEAYQAAGQAQLFSQYDMERVEILKGPQGTLFGRNATGGLVHYITKMPGDEYEGYADVSYGRYDTVRFEGAVGGPITEGVKARVSGFYRRHDAILENIFQPHEVAQGGYAPWTGNTTLNGSTSGQDDLWTTDEFSLRGQLLIEPNEDIEILLKGGYAQSKPASGPYQNVATVSEVDAKGRVVNTFFSSAQTNPNSCEQLIVGTTDCIPGGSALDLDFDDTRPAPHTDFFGYSDPDGVNGLTTSTDHSVKDYDSFETVSFTGKLSWDLDWATLVAVSSYSDQDKIASLDVDSGPGPQLIVTNNSKIDWFTQELRLEGDTERLRWILGLYYLTIDGGFSQCLCDTIGGVNVFGGLFIGVPNLYLDGSLDAILETDSYSVFGQVDYDLTDQLALSFGYRFIREEKDYDFTWFLFENTDDRTVESYRSGATPFDAAPGVPGVQAVAFFPEHHESTSDSLWSAKMGLEYAHSDNLLLYGSINRGVKAGSYNAPLLTFLFPKEYYYDEEVLMAYEVGFKSTVLNGKARINAAAYWYDYTDYQVFQFIGTSGAVFNADAVYRGFEVELVTNPVDNLDMLFGISYIDPRVKDVSVANTDPPTLDGKVLRDVEPSFTPEVQFNALGRYTWPNTMMSGRLSLQVDGNYASSSFHNINNFDTHKMESYWRGNASLTWVSADEHWEVTGFVDNFSDTRNMNIGYELAAVCGCDEQSFGYPRMYGAKIRYNYF